MTKKEFYDIFVLCLYWQSDPLFARSCFTTVDKVSRILLGLNLLEEKEKSGLPRDITLQQHFWSNIELGVDLSSMGVRLEEVLGKSRKELMVLVSSERVADPNRFNKARLLRNEHIYITSRGVKVAGIQLEAQYSSKITLNRYLEEVQRQEEIFSSLDETARIAILERYRAKVNTET